MMNQADLLEQFVAESRECLEAIATKLLEVERDPTDLPLLNDLFRSVHTLKGNCGLFEFKPLELVVHAGEDLLDRVRNRTLDYSPELADALLEAVDYSARLIDEIERAGRIDPASGHRAAPLAAALRALIPASDAGVASASVPASAAPGLKVSAPAPAAVQEALPGWVERVPDAAREPGRAAVALRYVPEPECFFKGEDPWRLACTTPGLVSLHLVTPEPWPVGDALDALDCYRCNLDLVLLSSAPRAEVEAHFRCVPEQVECLELPADAAVAPFAAVAPVAQLGADANDDAAAPPTTAPQAPPATPAEALLLQRALAIWADQLALLVRPGLNAGSVSAAARSLRGLLCALPEAEPARAGFDALPLPLSAATLLDWARRHPLDGARQDGATVDDPNANAEATALLDALVNNVVTLGGGNDAPPPPGAPRGAGDDAGGDRQHRVLKVGQEKIDRMMDLIGEMVVAKNSLPYLAQRAEDVFQQRELAREIRAQYAVINRIAEDMQHAIMQVRMLPVGAVFQRFGRLVRDISKKLGKDVQMVIEGEETEADKNVIEALADPLIHILRNALDHGIEMPEVRRRAGKPAQGTIRISARQESDRVLIVIAEDGAGVNAERVRMKAVERGLIPADRAGTLSDEDAVQLIFLPGFSTAETISDLSGRGVGMDVVRTAVERINGNVELVSRAGKGTTITLSLPLSMAVTNVMVIESAGRRFGVPMDLIVETVRVHADDIHRFKDARTTVLRGRIVPLRPLNELLTLEAEPLHNEEGELAVLVVRMASGNVGLLVDHFHGASDIILKPLEGVLAGLTAFSGTALMGDGSVLMVLNPKELV